VTAQARRDASIRAVEDERRRLAWDIHDAPLQELSGVIRRLDDVSGAEDEATALRSIAGHLREVATTLHPPVLQDLGLAAALEDLRERLAATSPSWEVVAAVDDRTNDRRPPSSVELAAYRIVQEATANAISHSGGHRLSIRGSVASEVIDLRVVDDGHGLRDDAARAARRAGHFGLDSMRERAEAEGGSTTLSSSRDGVTVRFRWTAGT
jgi:signal transduction histidine kinase